MEQSFALIDQEIGEHNFSLAEYAIVRRVIHSTADFEFKQLIRFSPEAIEAGIAACAAAYRLSRTWVWSNRWWVGGTNFWQPGD